MIKPLQEAVNVWQNPQPMLDEWEADPAKIAQEILIAGLVGEAGKVVELGCGNGRYAGVLNHSSYQGYDSSYAMIEAAKARNPQASFALIDIFKFQSDESYDTLLLIDVAIHQDKPIEAVLSVLNNWYAQRYVITLLVGVEHQDLYSSTVVSHEELEELFHLADLEVIVNHHQPVVGENFDWHVLVFNRI